MAVDWGRLAELGIGAGATIGGAMMQQGAANKTADYNQQLQQAEFERRNQMQALAMPALLQSLGYSPEQIGQFNAMGGAGLIGGSQPQVVQQSSGGGVRGALSSAASGASIGGMFGGPLGAGIGAGVGALISGIGSIGAGRRAADDFGRDVEAPWAEAMARVDALSATNPTAAAQLFNQANAQYRQAADAWIAAGGKQALVARQANAGKQGLIDAMTTRMTELAPEAMKGAFGGGGFGATPAAPQGIDMTAIQQPNAQQYAGSAELQQLLGGEGYAPSVINQMRSKAIEDASNMGRQQVSQGKIALEQAGLRDSGALQAALRSQAARETAKQQGAGLRDIDIQNAQLGAQNKQLGVGMQTNIGLNNMQAANAMALANANRMFEAMSQNAAMSHQNRQQAVSMLGGGLGSDPAAYAPRWSGQSQAGNILSNIGTSVLGGAAQASGGYGGLFDGIFGQKKIGTESVMGNTGFGSLAKA